MVIQENEIFGRKRRIPRAAAAAKSEAIESFVDLSAGDYVVHVNYGIGKYHGLERMRVLATSATTSTWSSAARSTSLCRSSRST